MEAMKKKIFSWAKCEVRWWFTGREDTSMALSQVTLHDQRSIISSFPFFLSLFLSSFHFRRTRKLAQPLLISSIYSIFICYFRVDVYHQIPRVLLLSAFFSVFITVAALAAENNKIIQILA